MKTSGAGRSNRVTAPAPPLTGSDGLFDSDRVKDLLVELGRRLAARDVHAKVFVVGGAAMALAFNRSRLTRDIDAVFEPKKVVYEVAAEMADELGLPAGWLNDGVKGFLPAGQRTVETNDFVSDGIEVGVASAPYLFAMKAAAARSESDREDLIDLMGVLDVRSVDEAFTIIEGFYARDRLQPKTQFVIEEIFNDYISGLDTG